MNLRLILAKIDIVIACVAGMFLMDYIFIVGFGVDFDIPTEYVAGGIGMFLFYNLAIAAMSAIFAFHDENDMSPKFYISTHIVRACTNLLAMVLWVQKNGSVLSMNIETIFAIAPIAATAIGTGGIAAAVIARRIKSRRYGVPSRLMTLDASEFTDLLFQTLGVVGIGVVLPFFILTLERQWWSATATAVCIFIGFCVGLDATIPTIGIRKLILWGTILSALIFLAYLRFAVAVARGDDTLVDLEIYALVAILAHWGWAFVIVVWSFCTAFVGKPMIVKSEHELFISASRHNNNLWVVLPCEFKDGLYRYECGRFQFRSIESLENEEVEWELVSDVGDYKKKIDETILMSALDMLYSGMPLEAAANRYKVDLEVLRAADKKRKKHIEKLRKI